MRSFMFGILLIVSGIQVWAESLNARCTLNYIVKAGDKLVGPHQSPSQAVLVDLPLSIQRKDFLFKAEWKENCGLIHPPCGGEHYLALTLSKSGITASTSGEFAKNPFPTRLTLESDDGEFAVAACAYD
jgi:hypothetical protein